MASNISSISKNPVARILASRDGDAQKGGEQFREQLAKQDQEDKEIQTEARATTKQETRLPASGGEVGAHLDITG